MFASFLSKKTNLVIAPIIQVKGFFYELSGLVVGTVGHSTALCKSQDGRWEYFDDSKV